MVHAYRDRIKLPLRIRSLSGAFCIVDAAGRRLSYTYFSDTDLVTSDHLTRDEAREIARMIARAVTDSLE